MVGFCILMIDLFLLLLACLLSVTNVCTGHSLFFSVLAETLIAQAVIVVMLAR